MHFQKKVCRSNSNFGSARHKPFYMFESFVYLTKFTAVIWSTYQYYCTCLYSLDSRNSSYFFEPMRDAERGFNMSFPHWLPWSSNQIQIGFSTLDKLFSCQYVSKLQQRPFDFLVAGDCGTVQEKDILMKSHPISLF